MPDTAGAYYGVARFLAVEHVDSPAFTPAGRLLFLAYTSGTPQVWTVDEPGAWPTRLTPHEERASALSASPADESFVYAMDRGSDERDQLLHYDLATGVERALTDDPESKHAWGAWGPDGDCVAYTANREADGRFDVYVQEVGGVDGDGTVTSAGDPERVYEGPGGWLNVAAFGPEGRRIVLTKAHSSSDEDLTLLDLESGETTNLSDDSEATYSHVHFDGDGGLLCVTNRDSDTAYVARLSLSDGSVTPVAGHDVTADATGEPGTDEWDVDGLAFDRDTGRIAYTVNEGGYSSLSTGTLAGDREDPRFDPTPTPDVDGIAADLVFGPEAGRLAYTHTSPTTPYGVRTCGFADRDGDGVDATGTATDWTPVGRNGLPDSAFHAPETVRYETFDGRAIPAYWTLPPGVDADDPDERVPAIVDIHGGPEHQRRPWFYPTKQYFLNRGYAVLEPNVRGSSGYGTAYSHLDDVEKRMDSVADIAAGVEWLAEQPSVDDDRIVAYGRSYGGFMVLAAITEYPDLWAAAVDFVGIADFTTFLENTGEWRRSHREAEYGSLDDDYEFLKSISPLTSIEEVRCPLFVQHGANDPRVPVGEAEQVAEAVREQGVPVETLIFEDEGHHTTSRENLIAEFEAIADFLDEHV
ncbi:S9 family peptidase [Halobaculum magnesiiphilum]|uniref:S9 family peptidase n=1 Tax=Halobaculum magnesiiphilum TaxID=1017351 RepID=A0A8T8WAG2_9EURY|nr:S9 family peptidase [Halobaculum magnesiiphilum]QZP36825.1 S9 family peptidase [Halobaculum magnesiiphilum]